MSIFRRFSNVFQQKANAAVDRMEDPAQAIDLSYQQLLEQQQKMRGALVSATTGKKRLENQAAELDARVAKLNSAAQAAVENNREDLATQALTQAEVVSAQRQALTPQLATITAQVAKLEDAVHRYQDKISAFGTQRETLKAQYEASKATASAGDTLAGIGEHTSDAVMMMQRAQDKIAHTQAHADAVDELLASGALDQPMLGGTSTLDDQIQVTISQSNVQAKLAAMKERAGIAEPAGSARLAATGIVVRIHGDQQYRVGEDLRTQLDDFDHQLVDAVRRNDDAAYHTALHGVLEFVRAKGTPAPATDTSASDIFLPSEDMGLAEVNAMLAEHPL